MLNVKSSILVSAACAVLLSIPLAAAGGVAAKTNSPSAKTMRSAWHQEAITGKIEMVNPEKRQVIVKTADGVSFAMVVTMKTLIKAGDQTLAFKDLTNDINKTATVRFTPARRGDVANSIRLIG